MFENVDGRTDAGVTGILIAHLGAFGSGELKRNNKDTDQTVWNRRLVYVCVVQVFLSLGLNIT